MSGTFLAVGSEKTVTDGICPALRGDESEPSHHLYVYYRVAADDVPAVVAAAMTAQCALEDAWPGLRAALLRRSDDDGDASVTMMEVYAGPAPALVAAPARVAEALARWIVGARHVEAFERCARPPPATGP